MKGETGVKLQYTHCRLISLEENSRVQPATECNPEILKEVCVDELLFVLGLFEEIIYKSQQSLEPCLLVTYLFRLRYFTFLTLNTLYKFLALNNALYGYNLLFSNNYFTAT